ncbi:MAG: helix-turn-helix domain-containing protein [Planctomycetes bacterium]|nr:helix-turn-helix domain-containing protein [Planctomycetota bacterium]
MTNRPIRVAFAGQGTDPRRVVPRHAHAHPIIIWYTKGSGELVLDDRTISFAPRTVICVPAGQLYSERSRHGFISLFIAIAGLPLPTVESFQLGEDPRFALAARLVLEESRRLDPAWPDAGMDALAALMSCLRRHRQAPVNGPLVASAVEWVRLHAGDAHLTMTSAATRLGTTVRRLRSAFLLELGMTPLRYLTAYRVAQAKRLLAGGGFTVGDVARLVGFQDAYYFSRVFRREVGTSPHAYRQRAVR